ncbi:hypothetical protein [Brevibacillus migulae]|uniref:hypothetical protein n=1 Tax=Brevibacillus migulae TaxID=1644114 RepID=UPI00106EE7E8|nr:hypothetical protein [Brevibacillus migulae]
MFEILDLLFDSYYPVLYLLSGITATFLFTRQRTLTFFTEVHSPSVSRKHDRPELVKVESYPDGTLFNLAFRLTRMRQTPNRTDDADFYLPAF